MNIHSVRLRLRRFVYCSKYTTVIVPKSKKICRQRWHPTINNIVHERAQLITYIRINVANRAVMGTDEHCL